MRVLLTVEFYHPHLGGAEAVTQQIAEGLAARGHDVHVATSRDPERVAGDLNGVTIHSFRVSGNEVKGLRGEVDRYREFLRGFETDVIINYAAQSWTTDVAMQELAHVPASAKVLLPCGYSGLSTALRRAAYRAYFQRLPARLRTYDLLIHHDAAGRDALFAERHGIEPVRVISNGVDLAEVELAEPGCFRADQGVGDQPLVINVSNHYRLKRHDIFHRLARGGPGAHFLLGQDLAPRWSSCAAACRRASHSGGAVVMGGDRRAVIGALADADVFAFTSGSEVAPLVLLEAAAFGTPWVSFDVGNARALRGGVVVRTEDEMAEAVRTLISDSVGRAALADEGRRFAVEQSWDRKIELYETALATLV